jgi:hypothetical protein
VNWDAFWLGAVVSFVACGLLAAVFTASAQNYGTNKGFTEACHQLHRVVVTNSKGERLCVETEPKP